MRVLSMTIFQYSLFEWVFFLAVMIPLTLSDIRTGKIPVFVAAGGMIGSGLIRLLIGKDYSDWFICLLPGLLFCVFSFLFPQSVGAGDGMVILFLGILLKRKVFGLLLIAALVSFAVSVLLILFKKVNRDTKLAFVPFLLAGGLICGFLG